MIVQVRISSSIKLNAVAYHSECLLAVTTILYRVQDGAEQRITIPRKSATIVRMWEPLAPLSSSSITVTTLTTVPEGR